jgi:hypothetical protein
VQSLREDRGGEAEFVTISYWESVEAMARFTGNDPCIVHHLPRDPEFLIELPASVRILEIIASHGNCGGTRQSRIRPGSSGSVIPRPSLAMTEGKNNSV